MLRGLDPILNGDLLKVLCDMGHGDQIAVVDANFTAYRLAAGRPVLRLDGVGLLRACEAILSVLPLDDDLLQPAAYMQVTGSAPDFRTPVQSAVVAAVQRLAGRPATACEAVERFAFYTRAAQAVAVVQTGELTPFANFLFAKAVILPP
ncbi:MAG: RbsD or FucU transport [Pseudomonadota bacterium]|nr:RbsD or FucU transport [Pseudomonadota bacterium]